MTNLEKYKTVDERAAAFLSFCMKHPGCDGCPFGDKAGAGTGLCQSGTVTSTCQFHWLEAETTEEDPLPCPFCCRPVEVVTPYSGSRHLACVTCMCGYHSIVSSKGDVVEKHNRVARASMTPETNTKNRGRMKK